VSGLAAAASAVEAELTELERLAGELERIELDSQQRLALAGRTLGEAFAAHARAVDQMRALGEAVAASHQRQRGHAVLLERTAELLQRRSAEFAELTTELMGLGEETRAIALALQALVPGGEGRADFADGLGQALARMETSVARAQALKQRALDHNISDIAEQAEAFAAQIAAARARLGAPING
jgi:hypothetical protein